MTLQVQTAASENVDVFGRVAAALGYAAKRPGKGCLKTPTNFENVTRAAQPYLAALVSRYGVSGTNHLWIVCGTEREQERFHSELSAWVPNALLFPHMEIAAVEGAIPDPETSAERLSVLQTIGAGDAGWVIVLNAKSFDDEVYAPGEIEDLTATLKVGERRDRDDLLHNLEKAGYEPVSSVADRGQFSVRGGIVDVYSWQQSQPVRFEWFGDEIASIREFDVDEQISIRSLSECPLLLKLPETTSKKLRDYRNKSDVVLSVNDAYQDADIHIRDEGGIGMRTADAYANAFFESPLMVESRRTSSSAVRETSSRRVHRQLQDWFDDGWQILIQYKKSSEAAHLREFLKDFTGNAELTVYRHSPSDASFVCPSARLAVTSTAELFGYSDLFRGRQLAPAKNRRGLAPHRAELDYSQLKEGNLVVHLEHGLARYRGIEARTEETRRNGEVVRYTEELMVLEFAEGAKLFVPLEQAFLVSRYQGIGKRGAALSKLGDGKWSATKKAAEKSIYDYAAKLLKTQALRESHQGRTYRPDTEWQRAFEDAFPYKETVDQVRAIADTKRDMESGRPMDRLICGDVGFGKTEVAIRAAFKAVNDGVQAAMMVPTTVLAQQHYENFKARMANFPVRVELLSRYRTAAEQAQVARGLTDGSVDLVVGTHRLISKDIAFRNLGLLIVDEEQRFGVRHKERIKEHFPSVDVLTLSATPIPRTLYLALTGARDLSTLETPPPSRFPVETVICGYDERVIRTAIDRELDRQGQIYFLHNRVESIAKISARIKQLCPRARVDIGHGQMEEGELEEVMRRFVGGETDVLVATTIIESGLDIPNANTIIIDRADRFGLADLYQLRGRVGRGIHKAYAYLMLPRDLINTGEARKRINAIKQYSSLGAGFKIALRDLEIRGAGNILGLAQSGHLTAVGFDLYCQLLRQAVSKLKGEKVRARVEVNLRLDFLAASETDYSRRLSLLDQEPAAGEEAPLTPWPAFLPSSYMEDSGLRVQAYRQIAAVAAPPDVDALQEAWRDRFGPLPVPAENLLALSRLKVLCAGARVEQIEVRGERVMISRGGGYVQAHGRFPRLTSPDPAHKMREIFSLIENL